MTHWYDNNNYNNNNNHCAVYLPGGRHIPLVSVKNTKSYDFKFKSSDKSCTASSKNHSERSCHFFKSFRRLPVKFFLALRKLYILRKLKNLLFRVPTNYSRLPIGSQDHMKLFDYSFSTRNRIFRNIFKKTKISKEDRA